jgi:hypothetical protein
VYRVCALSTSTCASRRALATSPSTSCPRFRARRFRFVWPRSRPLARPGRPWDLWVRLLARRMVRRASQADVLRRRRHLHLPRPLLTPSTPPSRLRPSSLAPSCPQACRVALWVRLDDARRRPSRPQGPPTVCCDSSTRRLHMGGRTTRSLHLCWLSSSWSQPGLGASYAVAGRWASLADVPRRLHCPSRPSRSTRWSSRLRVLQRRRSSRDLFAPPRAARWACGGVWLRP